MKEMRSPEQQRAIAQLVAWGFQVKALHSGGIEFQCGSYRTHLPPTELPKIVREPVTVASPRGRKTHRAIRIGRYHYTACGERWEVTVTPPLYRPVECLICKQNMGDTPVRPSVSERVVSQIRQWGDRILAFVRKRGEPSEVAATAERQWVTDARVRGTLWGVAVGDTLGKPLEFKSQDEVPRFLARMGIAGKLREVIEGGMGRVRGGITDDAGMTIALVKGVLRAGVDAPDKEIVHAVAEEFDVWLRSGPPDCGPACARGIHLFRQLKDVDQVARAIDPMAGGNGAIMRTAPLSLFFAHDPERLVSLSRRITRLTHASVAEYTSALYNLYLVKLMQGASKEEGLRQAMQQLQQMAPELVEEAERMHKAGTFSHGPLAEQFAPDYLKTLTPDTVGENRQRNRYNGYCVDTLRIALWAFLTTPNAEECLVETVNLGGDADSYGAVAGGLAGLYYGYDGLPQRWVDALVSDVAAELQELSEAVTAVVRR